MTSQATIIRCVMFGFVVFGLSVVILNYLSHSGDEDDFGSTKEDPGFAALPPVTNRSNQRTADYESNIPPKKLTGNKTRKGIPKVPVRIYNITIKFNEEETVLIRESGEGKYHILLLHDEDFTSKIWEKLGTLQYLAKWGYRAIAIDIPGKEKGSTPIVGDEEAIDWLKEVIRALRLTNVVLISPSSSGRLALPYIFQLKEQQDLIRGFIPIAPHSAERFPNYDYRHVNIPMLVVHAERDSKHQPTYELLIQGPTSEVLFMIDAGHDSYIDQTLFFHNGLREFLYKVYRPLYLHPFKSHRAKSNTKRRE